jgi:CheY-like chemotaxis protein
MRLNYKIVWFEDDSGFFDSLGLDKIEEHLDANGFDAMIHRMSGDEDLPTVIKEAQKSDLIIMDFGLEGGNFGDELIKQIRDLNINTEVIFYSNRGVGQLREFVRDKELDGIFCRPRDGIEHEVLPVIDSTIRKVLDLENSRGLAMAELGDLDLVMNSIIIDVHNSSSERAIFIKGKMKKRLESHLKSMAKELEGFDSLAIGALVENLDSTKRLNTMISICKELKLTSDQAQLRGYHDEVIVPRDCLGHGIPEETENGYVFRHRGKEYIYNAESSTSLRNGFRRFKKQLEELRKELLPVLSA